MTETCGETCGHVSRRAFVAGMVLTSASAMLRVRPLRASESIKPVKVATGLEIFPRASWGAQLPPAGPLAPEPDVRFLLIHHTAGSTNYKPNSVSYQIRQIYHFHTGKSKKWSDVCYNFFIDRFGGVWEGRQGSLNSAVMADATGGSQGFAQLVCLLGDFEKNVPPSAMLESCANVLAWLANRHKVSLDQSKSVSFISRGSNKWKAGTRVQARPISGHRDMSATLCPGKHVYPLLEAALPSRALQYQKIQLAN